MKVSESVKASMSLFASLIRASCRRFHNARRPGLDRDVTGHTLGQGTSARWSLHAGTEGFAVGSVASALATEFTAFSSLFLVLRLSSSDALEREPNCNDMASGPLQVELIITALDDSSCLDPSGFNRLSHGSETRSLGRESGHIR